MPLSNTNHLFSMALIMGARGYAMGYNTKSFNFADLAEPVPDSIYNKQSRCMVSSNAWHNMGQIGDFSCARTESYAPIIAVPPEVRALDPAWESCQAWYGGLFDRKCLSCRMVVTLFIDVHISSESVATC